jgi:hypothetical protein
MEEQKATERAERSPPNSIADALNTSMKTMSSLVAKYTAAVQAAGKPLNGEAKSETEGLSQRK